VQEMLSHRAVTKLMVGSRIYRFLFYFDIEPV